MIVELLYKEFGSACFSGPPRDSGVYGIFEVINKIESVLYIGSSKSISKRVLSPNHHYIKLIDKGENVYTRSIVCSDYKKLESELIKKYRPILNKQMY